MMRRIVFLFVCLILFHVIYLFFFLIKDIWKVGNKRKREKETIEMKCKEESSYSSSVSELLPFVDVSILPSLASSAAWAEKYNVS